MRNNIAPRFVPAFLKNSLRPNQDFKYRDAEPAEPRHGVPVA